MKILEWLSPTTRVLIGLLLLCAAEYALNYAYNAPFNIEHVIKYAISYPIYAMWAQNGAFNKELEHFKDRINELEKEALKLEKTYSQMQTEVKLLLKILPKFLSKTHRDEFQREVEKYHEENYKEDE